MSAAQSVRGRTLERIPVAALSNGHRLELVAHRVTGTSPGPRLAFVAALLRVRSTARSFVAIMLVTVRIGLTPAGNSAAMIPSASLLFSTNFPAPPSQLKVLVSVL